MQILKLTKAFHHLHTDIKHYKMKKNAGRSVPFLVIYFFFATS